MNINAKLETANKTINYLNNKALEVKNLNSTLTNHLLQEAICKNKKKES